MSRTLASAALVCVQLLVAPVAGRGARLVGWCGAAAGGAGVPAGDAASTVAALRGVLGHPRRELTQRRMRQDTPGNCRPCNSATALVRELSHQVSLPYQGPILRIPGGDLRLGPDRADGRHRRHALNDGELPSMSPRCTRMPIRRQARGDMTTPQDRRSDPGGTLNQVLRKARALPGRALAWSPRWAALHEGHLSLVRTSVAACDLTVVTIFVNPTQFGPSEDFARYPRTLDADLQMLGRERADIVVRTDGRPALSSWDFRRTSNHRTWPSRWKGAAGRDISAVSPPSY